MNDLPRQKLGEIVLKHGVSVVENPRRCEGLLRDYCGSFRREVSVLTMALEERVALDLLAAAKTTPRQVLLGRLTQRLCDNLALSEQAARWAVNSWAFALGIVSAVELEASERQAIEKTPTVQTIAPPSAAPQIIKTQTVKPLATTQNRPQPANSFSAQKIIVAADGSGDFSTVREALSNAATGARLFIRPGVYRESILLDKMVEIVGDGGAVEEIIVESIHSSCIVMETEQAIVCNLTLRGRGANFGKAFFAVDVPRGELTLENCDITSDSLSCIAIHGSWADPLIKNCRVHDGADSGVYIFDNARGQIEKCDVYQNANANVAITSGANPSIKNCRIFEGGNGGVVAWQNGAAGEIENCEIFNHRLANIGVSDSANPTFRSCKIFGGRDSGVFIHQSGYGTFEDCAVHDNQKAEVVIIEKSNSTLRRCAIYNGANSGIFVDTAAQAAIESCNIYDNSDAGISIHGESVAAVRRCNIHRNGKVAVKVKGGSAATVENCDLRGNRVATWESEAGVVIERKGNRE